jgi:alkylation response protein AidB-like acyl-CoA dehydrogenase
MTARGHPTGPLTFEDMRVPAAALLGGIEGGHCMREAAMAKLFASEVAQGVTWRSRSSAATATSPSSPSSASGATPAL